MDKKNLIKKKGESIEKDKVKTKDEVKARIKIKDRVKDEVKTEEEIEIIEDEGKDIEKLENDKIIDKYIDNINSKEYLDYLLNYKKIIEEKNKCVRNKKCSSNIVFEENKITFLKNMEKKELNIPKYINITKRLDEIKEEKSNCDNEIRFLQNKINIDSDSNTINNYKQNRDKYIELEKEEANLLKYLENVNNTAEKKNKIMETKNHINKIKKEKLNLYNELETLYKMKDNAKFNYEMYQEKIKLYIDNTEINKLKKVLKQLELFKLKSDELIGTENNKFNEVNFIIKDLPKNQKKIKVLKKK